jgi:hypothetical protein
VNDDDDSNNEITRSDLSLEAPTDRANLRYQLEDFMLKGHTDWLGKADFELSAGSMPGSSRNKALTVLFLGFTVCLIAGVAWGIGLPALTALIAGFAGAIVLYLLVHVTSDRR